MNSSVKKLILGLAVVLVAVLAGDRYLRLGRDVIFYSADVNAFTLPNGKVVSTNRWYVEAELIGPASDFYTTSTSESGSAACLAISDPEVHGVARVADRGGQAGYLSVLSETAVVFDLEAAVRPVSEPGAELAAASAGGSGTYCELWVEAVYVPAAE